MFSKLSLYLGVIITVVSCVSPEKLLKDTSADRLYFGKFGGFTNIPVEYLLINNEHVYKIENEKYNHVAQLTRSQSKQIKALLNDAGISNLQLNEPGNMTYYIRMSEGGIQKEIKWTDQTQNAKVKDLYKVLLSTVNQ